MTGPRAWSVTRDCLRTASGSCSFGAKFVTVSRPFRIRVPRRPGYSALASLDGPAGPAEGRL